MHSGVLRCISSPAGRAAAWHNWKAGFLLKAHPGHRAARSETEAGLAESSKQRRCHWRANKNGAESRRGALFVLSVAALASATAEDPLPSPVSTNLKRCSQSSVAVHLSNRRMPLQAILSCRPSLKAAVHPPANLGLRRPALGRYSTPLPQTKRLRDFKMTRRARK